MKSFYLEFEKPIQDIDLKILEIESDKSSNKVEPHLKDLKNEKDRLIKNIFSKLSRWEKVQLARHPQRPLSLDYIKKISPDYIELHGDRHYGDDPSVICAIASVENVKIIFIAQQKGRNTKENLLRNFGMMRPEGYRKSLRVMKLAEKFSLPIVSLIDTPGAYPGLGAEERGQGEAIARNLLEMSSLKTPLISLIIGEGASGGALGIGICDRMIMLENTWYSVISPEGCASILWRDAKKAPEAADAMKVVPSDLLKMGICDRIVEEPLGGAHRNFDEMANILKKTILEEVKLLSDIDNKDFLQSRIDRYQKMGVFEEL